MTCHDLEGLRLDMLWLSTSCTVCFVIIEDDWRSKAPPRVTHFTWPTMHDAKYSNRFLGFSDKGQLPFFGPFSFVQFLYELSKLIWRILIFELV